MDAEQEKKLEIFRTNTSELGTFIRYFFIWLLVVGFVSVGLLNLGGDVFEWGLRNFSAGILPKLTVILPIFFILIFPPYIGFYGANFFMRKRWLGELARLILVYVALAVYFIASAWLFSANSGFTFDLDWYGKLLAADVILFFLSKTIRLYAQATRRWLPQIKGENIPESVALVERVSSRLEIALMALMLALVFMPMVIRLFQ